MTKEQKRKAISMLHAAEAANEHASLALMDCGLETPEELMRRFGVPLHVVLEQQLHRSRWIREWLEMKIPEGE